MSPSRQSTFLNIICWVLCLAVTACQVTPVDPTNPPPVETTVTVVATERALPSREARATATAQPVPTIAPHLDLDPSVLRGVQIDFWHPWRGDLATRVTEATRQFNQENPWGMWVRARSLYSLSAVIDQVDEKYALETLPADAPELVAAPADQLAAWYQQGRLVSLNDYLADTRWGLESEVVGAFSPMYWQQDLIREQAGEQQLGIPALRTARVLIYNQSWAKELGFDQAPTTPEQFREQACAATQANSTSAEIDKRFTGGWLVSSDGLTMLSWFDAFGAQVLPADEGQAYTFQTPDAEEALGFLRGMFDDGCAWEGRNPVPYDYFSRRMALFYSGTLQDIALQKDSLQQMNNPDKLILLPFPAKEGQGVVYSSGYSYGLLAGAPDQQLAAWLFVRWMSTAHQQALLAEVWPSLPVSSAVEAELTDYRQNEPWSMILPLQAQIRPAPGLPSWRKVRLILEDAVLLQLFRLPVDQMEFILPQLDEMTREILTQEQLDK